MIGRNLTQPGYLAATVHRLSGVALALFLPLHFLALGTALSGANRLDGFLKITRQPLVEAAEVGLVVTLSVHLALGLRLLAIEFFAFREKTLAVVSCSFVFALGAGLLFLLELV